MTNYYNENVKEDIDFTIVNNPFFYEWFSFVKDILLHDEFQKRKLFLHHHQLSVWDHSILVSFKSFLASKYFHADSRICAIAGLLHDFYPYAWLYNEELESVDNGIYLRRLDQKRPLLKKHGFTHAKEAALNYVKYFPELEDKRITNAIKRHMFPLNIIPPRYKEGFIVTSVDKLNSVRELPSLSYVSHKVKEKALHILFEDIEG